MDTRSRNGHGTGWPRLVLTEQSYYGERKLPLPEPTVRRWVALKGIILVTWIAGAAFGVGFVIAHEAVVPMVAWGGGVLMGGIAWAFERLT